MSHYGYEHAEYKVKFRPGYETTDFRTWWKKQTPCDRDGCTSNPTVRILNGSNYTKSADAKYDKLYRDHTTKAGKDIRVTDRFMECVPSYDCHAVLLGVTCWRAVRKVRKIVRHHIQEVEEHKDYKTKPKTPLKGSTLYAIGVFRVSFDARDYDPMEHGDYPQDDD